MLEVGNKNYLTVFIITPFQSCMVHKALGLYLALPLPFSFLILTATVACLTLKQTNSKALPKITRKCTRVDGLVSGHTIQ